MKAYVASHLKDMNRQKVYDLLNELEETSKAELSKLTGISAPTVIKIINFLQEKALIEETGSGESAMGRKPHMLKLNKNRFYSIGVIYDGDFLKAGIVNLRNEIIYIKKEHVTGALDDALCRALISLINDILVESNIRRTDVLGIGLGIPGIIDIDSCTVEMAPLIGVVEKTDMTPFLQKIRSYYNMPVFVENDLSMEVMGEFYSLNLDKESDLIFLSLGTGIGSGVMLGGKLRRGARGMCGEVGYMEFSDDYTADIYKAGWLESRINLHALHEKFSIEPGLPLPEDVRKAAIEYVASYSALCINNLIMSYDCVNLSLGGENFDLLGEGLFTAIDQKTKKLTVGEVKLRRQASPSPGIVGAAGIATRQVMEAMLQE